MPIYAYRCSQCGHEQDVLQKISAAPLTECPQCHGQTFSKQLTAPAFQLKGTGWYVTDFRDNGKKPADSPKAESKAGGSSDAAAPAPAPASGPAPAAAAPAPSPAAGPSPA